MGRRHAVLLDSQHYTLVRARAHTHTHTRMHAPRSPGSTPVHVGWSMESAGDPDTIAREEREAVCRGHASQERKGQGVRKGVHPIHRRTCQLSHACVKGLAYKESDMPVCIKLTQPVRLTYLYICEVLSEGSYIPVCAAAPCRRTCLLLRGCVSGSKTWRGS